MVRAGRVLRTTIRAGAWNAQGVALHRKPLRDRSSASKNRKPQLTGHPRRQRESDRLFSVYPGPLVSEKADHSCGLAGKFLAMLTGVHRDAEVWVNGMAQNAPLYLRRCVRPGPACGPEIDHLAVRVTRAASVKWIHSWVASTHSIFFT
jgi:hypothetical protein